jgi:tetratricopeptide (TPR) repeat protein
MYKQEMFQGRRLLDREQYAQARDEFVKAARMMPDSYSNAFAATASYKLNDTAGAERFIQEAAKLDGKGYSYLRILAYRALILLKEGRQKEGLDTLRDYLATYQNENPLTSILRVEAMVRTGNVNPPLLEALLDEQLRTYESDIDQFLSNGTGWYGMKYGPPAGWSVP